ncbi:replication initiation protein, partial [Sulfitobacter sp. 1A12126]|uniref:replication initiation protein n=1 Tax=Sulfitobacter sp. 1A12126 TaxID=3368591 RepID=UPI003746692E
LKAAIKGLMETVIEFDVLDDDGQELWEAMVLLPYARLKGGICTYRYEPSLAEKLYHPDVYSKINLSVLKEMKSAHALVLYENCYRYVDIAHTPWWDLSVFRKLMAVDDLASYKQFKLLNRAVIQPAMREVNELSNIQLELETKRKGRSITDLRFLIRPNPQLSLIGMEAEDDITRNPAYKALLDEGIAKALARAWLLEHGEEYILEKIDLVRSQAASGKIKSSKAGFLKSAVEKDYRNENKEKKKVLAASQAAKASRQTLEGKLEALKAAQKRAERNFRASCVEIIEDALSGLSEGQRAAFKAEFQLTLDSAIYVNSFKKDGWRDRLAFPEIKKFWEARELCFPSEAEWAEETGSQEPQALKVEIEKLERELKQTPIATASD